MGAGRKMGVIDHVLDLPRSSSVLEVKKEPFAHNFVYACSDIRQTLLVLSQRMSLIQQLVTSETREPVKRSSLYANAAGKTRAHRSFRVVKLRREEVPAWLHSERDAYDRVAICAQSPNAWVVA